MTLRDSRLSFVEPPAVLKKSVQSRTEITWTGTFRASAILADPSCCLNFVLAEFQGEMTRRRASHSRSCWFWQTNLSRNNDGTVVLVGDDETNGMCPIIGSDRNAHIVGLSTLYPEASNDIRSPFALSLASSVCLFIRLCVSVYSSAYLICRLLARVFINLRLIARQRRNWWT